MDSLERHFYRVVEGRGWTVVRGTPFYTLYKKKKIIFVLIKDNNELECEELKALNVFTSAGLNCYIWRNDSYSTSEGTLERFQSKESWDKIEIKIFGDTLNKLFGNLPNALKTELSDQVVPNQLYVINSGDVFKVGISHSPKRRLKRLQTANPNKLKLVFTIKLGDKAAEVEKAVHLELKPYWVYGEWFKCPLINIKDAINKILKSYNEC